MNFVDDSYTDLRKESSRVMSIVRPRVQKSLENMKNNCLNLDRVIEEFERSAQYRKRKNKKNDPHAFTDKHIVALVGSDQLDSPLLNMLGGSTSPTATWEKMKDPSTHLVYYYCQATGQTQWEAPPTFVEIDAVTTLSLCDHVLGDEACPPLSRVLAWSGRLILTTLKLRENNISDAGAEILAEALFQPGCKLEHLELQGNIIGNVGVKALASTFQCGILLSLDLARQQKSSRIAEDGVQALADALLKPACRVRKLSLSGNKSIDCACVLLLADAIYTRNKAGSLKELYLSGTGVKDKGAVALSRCLKLLSNLSLSGCRIKDIGGEAIANAEKTARDLRGLDIQGNSFSPKTIDALVKNALPDTMVSVTLSANGSAYAS